MQLTFVAGKVSGIRDYRYVPYVVRDASFELL
jgi:hypothetical protein